MWPLVGPAILLLVGVASVAWDRTLPASAAPDRGMVRIGVVLTIVGLSSFFLWWLIVPVAVLVFGASMIVRGRHRVVVA